MVKNDVLSLSLPSSLLRLPECSAAQFTMFVVKKKKNSHLFAFCFCWPVSRCHAHPLLCCPLLSSSPQSFHRFICFYLPLRRFICSFFPFCYHTHTHIRTGSVKASFTEYWALFPFSPSPFLFLFSSFFTSR